MRPSRPRLFASALSALLVAALGFALFTSSRPPRFVADSGAGLRTYDVGEMGPPAIDGPVPREPASGGSEAGIAVSMPRIAYTYGYSFRIDAGRIAAVQERHLALCRRLGPARCRVTSMRRGAETGEAATAALALQLSAPLAEAFGRGLMAISAAGGGETADRSIAAEDLSRQMIDSDARIRTREVLIRRLTALLATRSGNIQQAVEAERAINTAQEELEAARTLLAEMRGRVAMSAVEISYLARDPIPSAANPIADALDRVGSISTSSLGAMILLLGVALPWLILGGAVFTIVRVVRRRFGQGPESEG
ncbi:MAG TPA: DUF4349 domain-containing protein [Allosphingosinicella sp.]|nr:DUF4349 domain-containing protein [Allosphingosinicella sp.]